MRSTAYDLGLWESAWFDFGVGLCNRSPDRRGYAMPPPDYAPRMRSALLEAYPQGWPFPRAVRIVRFGTNKRPVFA